MGGVAAVRMLPAVVALAMALAGCASSGPHVAGNHRFHRPPGEPVYRVEPYQVKGVWYTPRADYSYDETGIASWYGPGFDQQLTADNEIYDMNQLSAAHKTLPLPSVVEVTNLQNGRAMRLRINDRGPFVDGRIIDLSRRAAQLLGFEAVGTAQVRVRILREESIKVAEAAMRGETGRTMLAQAAPVSPAPMPHSQPPPPIQVAAAPPAALPPPPMSAPPPSSPPPPMTAPRQATASASPAYWPTLIAPAHAETLRPPVARPATGAAAPVAARSSGRIFVQAGTFAVPENAQRVRARIAALGSVEIVRTAARGTELYRVRLGPVANEVAAARLLGKVVDSGYPGARVVSE
jgi:rare lipoprotein A